MKISCTKKVFFLMFCFIAIPAIAANVVIDADKQAYDYKTNSLNFSGNVNVKVDNITIESPEAKAVMDEKGKLSGAVFSQGAHATQDNITSQNEIKANIINVSLIKKQIEAQGDVVSVINDSNKPIVTISSDVQEFDINTNIMTAQGNVRINYKNIKTTSQEAKIKINSYGNLENIKLIGNGYIVQGNHSVKADIFEFSPVSNNMLAKGHTYSETILENGQIVKINSDQQQYDKNKDVLTTTGNVKIKYQGYIATGPKATFIPEGEEKKLNKVVFQGRSKIKESNREIEADSIEMTLNPRGFSAQGNVRSYFSSVEGFDSNKKK